MPEIDRSSPIPIYYQLKVLLQEQIEQGKPKPGDKFPTEEELCNQYKISRTPVRQALLELTREGVLSRTPGRGTFLVPRQQQNVTLHVTVPDARWQWPLEEATRYWNESRQGARITLSFSTSPLAELHDHLSLSVAQGNAPDISILDSVWVAEFAYRRYLYTVKELDPTWMAEARDGFYPSLLSANSYNDVQYALPTNADASVLWYRRDWFEAEGLKPPTTWTELLAVAKHFHQSKARARYRVSAHPLSFVGGRAGGETTTYQLLPLIWSAGGDLIMQGKVVLDSAATRQALTFLKELVHKEKLVAPAVVRQKWDGAAHAFARGEVALAIGGTYENFIIQSTAQWDSATFLARVGFVPLPAGPKGAPATLLGGMTYGIYRQSRHPQEALGLLKLALTPSVLKPFSLLTGQNPASIAVAHSIGTDEDGFLGRAAHIFAQGRSRPSLPAYDRVSQQFQEMVEAALTGQQSIDSAVSRATERISGITDLPIA